MTFRALSLFTLAAGAVTLAGGLALLGAAPGVSPEAGHLRAMKDRTTAPAQVDSITLADVAALPRGLSLAKRAVIERRGVSLEGWNQLVMVAGDGDLHLEITPAPRSADDPDTAYVTCEMTPRWRTGHRGWSFDHLLAVFRPNTGGASPWEGGPRRVRVTGWLLYDYQYDGHVSSWVRAHSAYRVSGWEIHPVTRLEAWDETRLAWVEVAR